MHPEAATSGVGGVARHLLDHVGGNSSTGIGIQNLQIKRAGNRRVHGGGELGAGIEHRRDRCAILEHGGAIDEVRTGKDNAGGTNVDGRGCGAQ